MGANLIVNKTKEIDVGSLYSIRGRLSKKKKGTFAMQEKLNDEDMKYCRICLEETSVDLDALEWTKNTPDFAMSSLCSECGTNYDSDDEEIAKYLGRGMSEMINAYVRDVETMVTDRDFDLTVDWEKFTKLNIQLRDDAAKIESQIAQLVCNSCDESSNT